MNTDTIQSKALILRAAALDWKMVLLLSVKSVLWTERSFRILEKEVRNEKDNVK